MIFLNGNSKLTYSDLFKHGCLLQLGQDQKNKLLTNVNFVLYYHT